MQGCTLTDRMSPVLCADRTMPYVDFRTNVLAIGSQSILVRNVMRLFSFRTQA
jgi:hypothetical protein